MAYREKSVKLENTIQWTGVRKTEKKQCPGNGSFRRDDMTRIRGRRSQNIRVTMGGIRGGSKKRIS